MKVSCYFCFFVGDRHVGLLWDFHAFLGGGDVVRIISREELYPLTLYEVAAYSVAFHDFY